MPIVALHNYNSQRFTVQARDVPNVKIQRSADADVIFSHFDDADADADTSFYKIANADCGYQL